MAQIYRRLGIFVVMTLLPVVAGAQTGTLFVEGENVGVGTATPAASLHVQKSDGTSNLVVEELSGTTQVRELFRLANNGGPFFIFADSSTSKSYSFAMSGFGDFIVSHQQTPGVQLRLSPSGNMTITGTLTQGSSRATKDSIRSVDPREVLEKVASLPVATWQYKQDARAAQHLGPMAEDFHAAFGLGENDRGISALDTSGVALAAVQGLYDLVREQREELAELRSRLAELEREDGGVAPDRE